jgi:hypothetical protein
LRRQRHPRRWNPDRRVFHSCSLISARKGFLCGCKTIMLNVKHNKTWRNRKPLLTEVYAIVYTKSLRLSQCSARGYGEHCTQTASVPYPANSMLKLWKRVAGWSFATGLTFWHPNFTFKF